jgi:Leucine-rich repeat (LRR) protein
VVVTCGIVAGVFLLGGDDEPVIDVGGEVTDTVGGITTTPSETEPTTPEIPDEPEPPIEPLEIDLSQQGITDEILAAMVADGRIPQNVTSLDLWQNFITDVSPLAELTNLTHLYLSENQITDVSPLAELTNLQVLWLVDNQVHDVSPLGGLTRLTWLSLVRNQITDVSPLAELTRLERLTLLGNPLDSVQISQIRAALPNAELDIN